MGDGPLTRIQTQMTPRTLPRTLGRKRKEPPRSPSCPTLVLRRTMARRVTLNQTSMVRGSGGAPGSAPRGTSTETGGGCRGCPGGRRGPPGPVQAPAAASSLAECSGGRGRPTEPNLLIQGEGKGRGLIWFFPKNPTTCNPIPQRTLLRRFRHPVGL